MEVDEKTLRTIIREEVWSAMQILDKLGIKDKTGRKQYLSPGLILNSVSKYPNGCHVKDIAFDLQLYGRLARANISGHLVKLYDAGKVLRSGQKGGDGYTYRPL